MNDLRDRISKLPPKKLALLALGLQKKVDALEMAQREPIAIVGMACRYPGGANDPALYWDLLRRAGDASVEIPSDRFDVAPHYDPEPGVPSKTYTRRGSFLRDVAVDTFDAAFFGISPREADGLDPQHRMLLEVAYDALGDAGVPPDSIVDSNTGVYVGTLNNDYFWLALEGGHQNLDAYVVTGNLPSFPAGRLSYALGAQGPSLVVCTACSSSLVAVHLAVAALRSRECDLALAAGVNLMLSPRNFIGMCQLDALAPDGRSKTFDAAADGYGRGEGCGVVVLKRLSAALAGGDRIHAVIRGTACNSDGASAGITVPNGPAQQKVIKNALRNGGVEPAAVSYVETHGTGTPLGDPVEVQALAAVLGEGRATGSLITIGSAKANIGHLEAAAGVAGLMKIVLALEHREMPPHVPLSAPNPRIPWDALPVRVPAAPTPWSSDGPRIAAVSSFGLSGINAHVVVEEAPAEGARAGEAPAAGATGGGREHLLTLSARSRDALADLVERWRVQLERDDASLRDLCWSAATRRSHYEQRLAITGASRAEIASKLAAWQARETRPGMVGGEVVLGTRRRVAFVFPGQGSQWPGMAKDLIDVEPAFRAALEACDAAIAEYAGFSVIEELRADAAASRLDEIDVIQPCLFAVFVSLAALWRSWGVEPDAVIGHSMGEVASGFVAGALSLPDAARVIVERSKLMRRLSGQGAMAVVELTAAQAEEALVGRDNLSVFMSNSPRSTVISGDTTALEKLMADLEGRGVFTRKIKIDVASHSSQMEPLCRELGEKAAGVRPRQASVPIYSTVRGEVCDGTELGADYWVDNLRQPVLFWKMLERALADGCDVFIEMSPHPVLLHAIEDGLRETRRPATTVASLRRGVPGHATVLEALGAVYAAGYAPDWRAVFSLAPTATGETAARGEPGEATGATPMQPAPRYVPMPLYPWQRKRFWVSTATAGDTPAAGRRLLGEHVETAAGSGLAAGVHLWSSVISLTRFGYLGDHRVQGAAVLPAAAYVEMALAGAAEALAPPPGADVYISIESITFDRMLSLPETGERILQLHLTPDGPGRSTFRFFSRAVPGDTDSAADPTWTTHAEGRARVRPAHEVEAAAAPSAVDVGAVRARCTERYDGAQHYAAMTRRGLEYGPAFQGVTEVARRDGEALGRVTLPRSLRAGAGAYRAHPALLDACIQVLSAAVPGATAGTDVTWVPVGVERVRQLGALTGDLDVHTVLLDHGDHSGGGTDVAGDLRVLGPGGELLLELAGLRIRRLTAAVTDELDDWFFDVRWDGASPPDGAASAQGTWILLADPSGESSGALATSIAGELRARGGTVVMAEPGAAFAVLSGAPHEGRYAVSPTRASDVEALFATALEGRPPCRGVVLLWPADTVDVTDGAGPTALSAATDRGCGAALHVVQALARRGWHDAPRLFFITRGAVAVRDGEVPGLAQAALWGLGTVVPHEHTELRCTRVDLDRARPDGEARHLLAQLLATDLEDQVALRGDERFVARVVRHRPDPAATAPAALLPAAGRAFRLAMRAPGALEHLQLRETEPAEPGSGEVQIEVRAAVVGAADVRRALGGGEDSGAEPAGFGSGCAGRICAVGPGVDGLAVGDEVVAWAPGSVASHVTVAADLVVKKPATLPFAEAAALPVPVAAAHFGLAHGARVRPDERVLVLSDGDATTLAALTLARASRLSTFAAADGPGGLAAVQSLGADGVLDARSPALAADLLARTGDGVDVIIGSTLLRNGGLGAAASMLRPAGRIVDLGGDLGGGDARPGDGVASLGRTNIGYTSVDLAALAIQAPRRFHVLLREVVALAEGLARDGNGAGSHFAVHRYPIRDVAGAFRAVAAGVHSGSVVLTFDDAAATPIATSRGAPGLSPDGTYLITGGLGGLGGVLARSLVERGARHLVLVGRNPPRPPAQALIDELRAAGVSVKVARADVAAQEDLARMLAEIDREMPPLRGVVHAAGVLADATLVNLDVARFRAVFPAKVHGAWNLHSLCGERPLDFFVLFSSAAATFGSPGQANYAAANAFLDTLARHRRARGLAGLSIAWGPWAEVGMAAQSDDRGGRLEGLGIENILPDQGTRAFTRVLHGDRPAITVAPLHVRRWRESFPRVANAPYLEVLAGEGDAGAGTGDEELLAALRTLGPEKRRSRMEAEVRDATAELLRLSPKDIGRTTPIKTYGLDSLMALQLRNKLEAKTGLTLSTTLVFVHPTVEDIAAHLARQLGVPYDAGAEDTAARAAAMAETQRVEEERVAELALMSEAEAEAELAAKLALMEDL